MRQLKLFILSKETETQRWEHRPFPIPGPAPPAPSERCSRSPLPIHRLRGRPGRLRLHSQIRKPWVGCWWACQGHREKFLSAPRAILLGHTCPHCLRVKRGRTHKRSQPRLQQLPAAPHRSVPALATALWAQYQLWGQPRAAVYQLWWQPCGCSTSSGDSPMVSSFTSETPSSPQRVGEPGFLRPAGSEETALRCPSPAEGTPKAFLGQHFQVRAWLIGPE